LREHPGAGTAGGTGFGLLAFLNATLRPGIEMVLEATQFADKLAGADLVLTGEGAIDEQTLSGKTIAGVCRVANPAGVSVIAFGGAVRLSGEQLDRAGLAAAFSLVDGPRTLQYCVENAGDLLVAATERVARLFRLR
jgi:glycerate kinase